MKKLVLVSAMLLSLSSCALLFKQNYEQPEYTILKSAEDIEIREYQNFIVAETVVDGDRESAPNKAFKQLAGYIFGGNQEEKSISMTAPVLLEKQTDSLWSMTFMMPSNFSLENLPKPNTDRIFFKEVENRKIAAIKFSGRWSKENFNEQADKLLKYIKKEGLKINSREINAFYDDPFTLPWNRRNEIMFEVE